MGKILLHIVLFATFMFANTKVAVDLLWRHQFEFAGYYMAKEKGFYKNVGLDVKLKEYKIGENITDDVLSGKADFGIGYPTVIKDIANGKELYLLHATFQTSPMVLVTRDDIKSFKDFNEKKVMVNENGLQNASLIAMLKANSVDTDSLKHIPITFNPKDLVNKKCDILEAYSSDEIYTLKQLGVKYKVWDPKDYGFEFYDNILFTSKKLFKQNPLLVENFNRATIKGWIYAFNHIDEAVNIILKKYNTQHKSKDALLYEAKVLKKLAFYKTDKFGDISKNKIERIFDIYKLFGLKSQNIDWEKYVYPIKESSKKLTKREKEWLKNNIVKVGVEQWAPLVFAQNLQISGLTGDIIKLMSKKIGLKFEIVNGKWDYLLSEFRKNQSIDLLPATYYTDERATYGFYTTPYYYIKEDLFARKDSKVKSFNEIKKLAIIKDYGTIPKVHKKYPNINIIQTRDLAESVKFVLEGKVDALYDTVISVNEFIKKNNIKDLKNINQTSFKPAGIYFFINKDKPMLKDILQKGLNQINDDTIKLLQDRWAGYVSKEFKLNSVQKNYLKNRVVKICARDNFLPFEDFVDGKLTGMTEDFINLFKKYTKAKIKIVKVDNMTELKDMLKRDKCDMTWTIAETKKTKKFLYFPNHICKLPTVIVTKDKSIYIDNTNLLKNKTVAVIDNSYVDKVLRNHKGIKLIPVENLYEGLKLVLDGRVFASVSNLPMANYNINKYFKNRVFISGRLEKLNVPIGSGVNKSEPVLATIVNQFINSIDGDIKKSIELKWQNIKYEKEIDYSYLWKSLIVLFIVFIIFYTKQKQLHKYNKKLQEQSIENKAILDAQDSFIVIIKDKKLNKVVNKSMLNFFGFSTLDEFKKSYNCICDNFVKTESNDKNVVFLTPQMPHNKSWLEYAKENKDKILRAKIRNNKKEERIFSVEAKEFYNHQDIVIFSDITAEISYQTKLANINKELQESKQELNLLNKSLESRIQQAVEENIKKEKLLQQQSRLAQMGEMISMIAHQWRQPLSAINSAILSIETKLALGKFDLKTKAGVDKCLDFINKRHNNVIDYVRTLSETIDDFRNFFKPDKQKEKASINSSIQKALKIVSSSMSSKGININTDFQTDKELDIYPNELMQVILNILKNSEDNFKEKHISNANIAIKTYEKNNATIIEICDNGGGIPKNILSNIFDPYFSTKNEKNGTGLGLYMSKVIIEEHHKGILEAYNKDNGACFKITIGFNS